MSEFAQLLYDRMMVKVDDWGIITGDTFELKGETIPLSSRTFQELDDPLQEMAGQDLVWRYEPDGFGPLIQIKKFDDHQPRSLINKRSAPKRPLHPDWEPLPDDDRSLGLLESIGKSDKRYPRVDKSRVDKNRREETRKEESTAEISDSYSSQWQAIISELKRMHDRKAIEQYFTAATCIKEVSGSRVVIGVKAGDVFMVKRNFQAKLAEAIAAVCPEWAERELIVEALQ